MNDLIIIGAGGFGREVAWLVEEINGEGEFWNLIGFIDDQSVRYGEGVNDIPMLGGIDFLQSMPRKPFVICAIGEPTSRKKVVDRLGSLGLRYATLVHPSVKYSKYVSIGEGSIICAGTIITTNVSIGNHVIINLDCTVGHDVVIEDYVSLMPSVNVSGGVLVREGTYVGTGASIIQNVTIGEWGVVGAGAVVTKDLPGHVVSVGVPARPVKNRY